MSPMTTELKFLTAASLRFQVCQHVALCLWVRVYRHFDRAWRLLFQGLSGPCFFFKYHGWEGKENHHCEGGSTVASRVLSFPFVFVLKESSYRPDFSRRWRREKRRQYVGAYPGSGVLWLRKTKLYAQPKQMPSQKLWLCWKTVKGMR
jgi:hypothetical protein